MILRLYKSYLIKNLFKPLIISVSTLTALIWSSRVIKYMDYVVQDGAGFLCFFKMTLFVLPSLILMILPLSVFLTAILTYNKFIESREIIILKNCGIKKSQLLNPLIVLSIIIALISYSISLYGAYKSNLAIRKIRVEIQNRLSFSMIKDGSFSKYKNLVIYADKNEGNRAINVIIYNKLRENNKNILLQAESAEMNGHIITLHNGNFQRFDEQYNVSPEILFFKEYYVDFNELSGEKKTLTLRLDSISTLELFHMLKNYNSGSMFRKNKIIYELNYRLLFPLVSVIMALLSGSMMLVASFNRISSSKIVMRTAVASIAAYILLLLLFQKVEDGIFYMCLLYFAMIGLFSFSLYLIKEKKTI